MVRIVGYGEDALSFWALTNRINDILHKLKDKSKESQCTVFYRPSFGRGGKGKANFGEFDAILSTTEYVYLIECKWIGSREFKGEKIKVTKTQQLRHSIFEWYFRRWDPSKTWSYLVQNHGSEYTKKFPEKEIAPPGSILSFNLEHMLEYLRGPHMDKEKNLKHILMFLHPIEVIPPNSIDPDWFQLISIGHPIRGITPYFDMTSE